MAKRQTLGARIAQARRELGVREHRDVTQLDLANAIGVTAATLSRWEADLSAPRDDAFVKLASVLGVDPGYLRYGVRHGSPESGGIPTPDPTKDRLLTDAEIERARRAVARKSEKTKPNGGRRRA